MSLLFLLVLLLPLTNAISWTPPTINKDDKNTLLKIKKQLGDPVELRNWEEEENFDFCLSGFAGGPFGSAITACDFNGRVTRLTLEGMHVSAPFPAAICDLSELNYLEIYNIPGLYGPIPSCVVTKLVKMMHFIIRNTSISGAVPEFYNSTTISTIDLSSNQLSGKIPSSLSTLPNLLTLNLSSNHLKGTLPPSLPPGYIVLSHNSLTGEIPKSYGLIDFLAFDVGYNKLSGDASFLFSKQKKTSSIILAKNNFKFDLSYVEFSDYLSHLDISHNKIYGTVPQSLATAASLFWSSPQPNFSCNRLCGELPQGGNMHWFKAEDFADNACLCGSPLPPCNYPPPPPPTYTPPF